MPASHKPHLDEPAGADSPELQGVHDELPSSSEYVFTGQAVHVLRPEVDVILPAGQVVQLLALPELILPAGHAVHKAEPLSE